MSIDALNTTIPNLANVPPSQLSIDALNTTTSNSANVPPSQQSIDALNTTTPNLADVPHPKSIEHRCLEYHYTKLGKCVPSQQSIDDLNTTTPNLADVAPSQLSIDALNTTKATWQIYIYRTVHIYPWQIDTPSHSSIECLEYCYTKLGRSIYIEQCTYTYGRLPPLQSSIDALNTATPNLADIEQCTYILMADGLSCQSSIDALNITTPNLAYVPPPINWE